jgi:16S rRNA (cytosine1402-N4)-methyltransferase
MKTKPERARNENSPDKHIPVLTKELTERIRLPQDAAIVDATVGHGGHSLLFGETMGPDGIILGLDVDESCITRAHMTLSSLACRVILVRENFARIAEVTAQKQIGRVDLILADLGFCSAQLTDVQRGLSFQENMPLDMRLDDRTKTTAADIVNNRDEKSLADLIYKFGQDRASRRIARFIVQNRRAGPITTTGQLATIVSRALKRPDKPQKSRIKPATRTFQALRIAVNDELGNLERLLAAAPALLKENGCIAVISFHSLEDGIVKTDFKQNKVKGVYEIVTKKPIVATRTEITRNPRSRSAKLRIAVRI